MQQMQYNALNRIYVLQQCSGVTPPDPLLVLRPGTGQPLLRNSILCSHAVQAYRANSVALLSCYDVLV